MVTANVVQTDTGWWIEYVMAGNVVDVAGPFDEDEIKEAEERANEV